MTKWCAGRCELCIVWLGIFIQQHARPRVTCLDIFSHQAPGNWISSSYHSCCLLVDSRAIESRLVRQTRTKRNIELSPLFKTLDHRTCLPFGNDDSDRVGGSTLITHKKEGAEAKRWIGKEHSKATKLMWSKKSNSLCSQRYQHEVDEII